jgi:BON domain
MTKSGEVIAKMRDSEIEQWVLSEIRSRTDGRLKELCVCSTNGIVSLKGTVLSRADELAAQEAAAGAKGVVDVIDQLNMGRRSMLGPRPGKNAQVVPPLVKFPHLNQEPTSTIRAAN